MFFCNYMYGNQTVDAERKLVRTDSRVFRMNHLYHRIGRMRLVSGIFAKQLEAEITA